MSNKDSDELIQQFYEAFNLRDIETLLTLISSDFVHDRHESASVIGPIAFKEYLTILFGHFHETVHDPMILTSPDGQYASAKFHASGNYVKTFPGYPEANGQGYLISVGHFFELDRKKITRYTPYFNQNNLINQLLYLSDAP